MTNKTDTQVIIGGKVLTMSGYESEEYLQKVAMYINTKLSEVEAIEGFSRQPLDMQNLLLQLNIADDYFKVKKQLTVHEEKDKDKDKELYDLKHELISTQIKLENMQSKVESLEKDLDESNKKIIRLETELKSSSNSNKGRK